MRNILDQIIKTQQVDAVVSLIIALLLIMILIVGLLYKPICKLFSGIGELLVAILSLVIQLAVYGLFVIFGGAIIVFTIVLGIILSPIALVIWLFSKFFD